MRRGYYVILAIIGLCWTIQAVATSIPGTVVSSKVTTGNTDNTFAVADTAELQGGMMQFAYSSALRLIPEARRNRGMLVYTHDTRQVYQLYSTPGHNWRLFSVSGGGGGAVSSVFGRTGDVQPAYRDYSAHFAQKTRYDIRHSNGDGQMLYISNSTAGASISHTNQFIYLQHTWPQADASFDLGSTSPARWRNLYLSGYITDGLHTATVDQLRTHLDNTTYSAQQQSNEYECTRKVEVKNLGGTITHYVQANGRAVWGTPMSGFPNISSVSPRDGATNVPRNAFILYYFSRDMEPTTITDENATMDHGVTGAVTYDSGKRQGMFSTFRNLTTGTTYQVTVSTGTRDVDCNAMQSAKVWSFTTTTTP